MTPSKPIKMLLLNASNIILPQVKDGSWATQLYYKMGIYPYAFVQVREVADRFGVELFAADISAIGGAPGALERRVEQLFQRERPDLVGITIRQVDSAVVQDYAPSPIPYEPLELTQRLIGLVRKESRAPIVLGGIGFTAMAKRLMEYLQPDYGVAGDPDGFFAELGSVLAGRELGSIPNLLYWEEGKVRANARAFYAPAPRPEYTDQVVDDLARFYGESHLFHPAGLADVPVEIARGCPYSCTFCIEPYVKGKQFRARDLDVVFADVELLAQRGVPRFFMVASEANIGNDQTLIASVAERMVKLRERYGAHLKWRTFHLPGLVQLFARSGFLGGWNDFVSLDPAGMRRARVPYNQQQALDMFKSYNRFQAIVRPGQPRFWTMFLGHDSNTPETIRTTLETMHREGLLEYYDLFGSISALRIYEALEPTHDPERLFSPKTEGRPELADHRRSDIFPLFHYTQALTDELGGRTQLEGFLAFLGSTILSTQAKSEFDGVEFLASRTTPAQLTALLASAEPRALGRERLAVLVNPRRVGAAEQAEAFAIWSSRCEQSGLAGVLEYLRECARAPSASRERRLGRTVARMVLDLLLAAHPRAAQEVEAFAGVERGPDDSFLTTPSFTWHRALLQRYGGRDELLTAFEAAFPPDGSLHAQARRLALELALTYNAVELRPSYRAFFCPPQPAQDARPA